MTRLTFSVALHTEGVDRNVAQFTDELGEIKSPSTRRAWIEIIHPVVGVKIVIGRPPHGGRG